MNSGHSNYVHKSFKTTDNVAAHTEIIAKETTAMSMYSMCKIQPPYTQANI